MARKTKKKAAKKSAKKLAKKSAKKSTKKLKTAGRKKAKAVATRKKPVAKRAKPAAKRAAPKKKKAKRAAKKEIFGEGNYTASRNFRRAETSFVKHNKAKIPELGKAAEDALDGPQGDELRAAEQEAAGHAKD